MVAHAFNSALRKQRQTSLSKFEAILFYKTSSKTAKKSCLKKKKKKRKERNLQLTAWMFLQQNLVLLFNLANNVLKLHHRSQKLV